MVQMEIGHKWLLETFPFLKDKIKVLWQIDPFGSSSMSPLLFGNHSETDTSFKYSVINRVGDQLKDELKRDKNMDFIWSNPFSPDSRLLTHTLYYHYNTMSYDMLKKYMLPSISHQKEHFFKDFHSKILKVLLGS